MGPWLPEPAPGLQEVLLSLVPRCWSCPLVSRAVKEGMEPRVDVKATSKLCDSFCSWDTGPDKRRTDHNIQKEVQQKRRASRKSSEDYRTALPAGMDTNVKNPLPNVRWRTVMTEYQQLKPWGPTPPGFQGSWALL